jgi:hypothetical protein
MFILSVADDAYLPCGIYAFTFVISIVLCCLTKSGVVES